MTTMEPMTGVIVLSIGIIIQLILIWWDPADLRGKKDANSTEPSK